MRIINYMDRADRAAVIMGGKVAYQGDVDEVYSTIVGRGYDAFKCQ